MRFPTPWWIANPTAFRLMDPQSKWRSAEPEVMGGDEIELCSGSSNMLMTGLPGSPLMSRMGPACSRLKTCHEMIDHALGLMGVAPAKEDGMVEDMVEIIELKPVLMAGQEGPRLLVSPLE